MQLCAEAKVNFLFFARFICTWEFAESAIFAKYLFGKIAIKST